MYAQLGNTVFEGLKGFSSFGNTLETNYAEHSIINGKPKLQQMGEKLEEISISIRLHRDFCDPEEEITKLNTSRVAGEVLPLVYGNGIYAGDYVLTALSKSVEQTDKEGTLVAVVLDLRLREYFSQDLLSRRKTTAVNRAFGLSKNAVPTIVGIDMTKSPGSIAAKAAGDGVREGKVTDGHIAEAAVYPERRASLSNRIVESLGTMKLNFNNLNQMLSQYQDLQDRAGNLGTYLENAIGAADDLEALMPITDIDAVQQSNAVLQNSLSDVTFGMKDISSSTIVRRI